MGRTGRGPGAAWVLLLWGSAVARGPVVGGVVARPDVEVQPDAAAAFEAGADEAPGGRARMISSELSPSRTAQVQAAVRALAEGEQRYLEFELEAARDALDAAVDGFLDAPTELLDAQPATRAVLRLAQVHIALKQTREADKAIERALLGIPRFPAGGSPPPDLEARIEDARGRLSVQFGARLTVGSATPGARVRVNGVVLGRTPLVAGGLARGPVRVTVDGPSGAETRLVDLASGEAEVQVVSSSETLAELRGAIAQGDAERGWRAASLLQSSFQADSTCLAVVDDDGVVVARLDASARSYEGGHRAAPTPSDPEGWRALGRFCSPGSRSNMAPAEVGEALWPESSAGGGGFGRSGWGWTAVGVGAASLGATALFGSQALQADTNYSRTGDAADEDAARSNALVADIALGVGVALVATGVYLLLTD